MVNFKKRAFFAHIPKTAGNSIEGCLLKHGFNKEFRHFSHTQAQQQLALSDKEWANFKIFTVARDPWDRIASSYLHCVRVEQMKPPPSLGEYIECIISYFKGELSPAPATPFILNRHGDPILDQRHIERLRWWVPESATLLRFDHIEEDWDKFKNCIDCEDSLPHLNTNPLKKQVLKGERLKSLYTDTYQQAIAEIYAEEIALLNFKFN